MSLTTALCALIYLLPHDPGLSSARLQRTPHELLVQFEFANTDFVTIAGVDAGADRRLDATELAATSDRWQPVMRRAFLLRRGDGIAAAPELRAAVLADNADVVLTLAFAVDDGACRLELPWLQHYAHGHRCYAALVDHAGLILQDALLSSGDLTFALPTGDTPSNGFLQSWRFLALGVEHILIGFDHLAFLLALLAARLTWRRALLTITAFSAAHSLTLACAVFGWLRLPSGLVEASIAASIVCVAAANLWQRRNTAVHRWPAAFGFGLVHGLGFASVLADFGVGGTQMWIPLVCFNVGVELGQLAFAAVALPLLLWSCRRRATSWLPVSVSLAVGAAGLVWCWQRVIG